MSDRLVRCPMCGQRFNITGISGGARLRCSACHAVLAVPRTRRFSLVSPSRGRHLAGIQIGSAVIVSLVAGYLFSLLFHGSSDQPFIPEPAVEVRLPEEIPPLVDLPREPEGALYLDREYQLTQKKIQLREEFGVDRIRFRDDHRPFLVAVERSERYPVDRVVQEYAERLIGLYHFFRDDFAPTLALPEVDEVLPVIILGSRSSYDAYTRRVNDGEEHSPQIKGVYEFSRKRIVLYHNPIAPYEVILHEGVHQLVHFYTRHFSEVGSVSTTQWFQEGLGTYFEGFRRTRDGRVLIDPGVNHGRLRAVKSGLVGPDPVYTPLAALTGMTIDGFWKWFREQRAVDEILATRKAQTFYGESWALVYFLRNGGEKYRHVFDAYFLLELSGKGGKESFEKVLRDHLQLGIEALEEDFIAYLETLK